MTQLLLTLKNEKSVKLTLKQGVRILDELNLTVSQDFDTLLITAIDKLLMKNKIDRLSLETLEIQGKMRPEAVSGMIIKTVMVALRI